MNRSIGTESAVRRRTWRSLAIACLTAAVGIAVIVPPAALAAGGSEGGRIYNPSRLREHKSSPAPGRAMRRPPIPDPDTQRPLRATAKIPNPEPRSRGGSGYVRRGKNFYLEAQPPKLTRERSNERVRATIPNPEPPSRRRR